MSSPASPTPKEGHVTEASLRSDGVIRQTVTSFKTYGPAHVVQEIYRRLRIVSEFQLTRRRGLPVVLVDGKPLEPVVHSYNLTWRNERAIEIALVRAFLDGARRPTLEVGNVISHYGFAPDVVVDKYELGAGVLNVDVMDYVPAEPFGSIVSISTLEHVGWDEAGYSGSNTYEDLVTPTIEYLRALLQPGGEFLVTCPLGFNPHIDALVRSGDLTPQAEQFFRRSRPGRWHQVTKEAALDHPRYVGGPHGRGADVLWAARFAPTAASK
jgi:hypothetical protein